MKELIQKIKSNRTRGVQLIGMLENMNKVGNMYGVTYYINGVYLMNKQKHSNLLYYNQEIEEFYKPLYDDYDKWIFKLLSKYIKGKIIRVFSCGKVFNRKENLNLKL